MVASAIRGREDLTRANLAVRVGDAVKGDCLCGVFPRWFILAAV